MEWVVTSSESGTKLISFLQIKSLGKISAKQLKRIIEAGGCHLNRRVERFASKLVGKGDLVVCDFNIENQRLTEKKGKLQAGVLYADERLFAIDKPPGICSDDPKLLTIAGMKAGILLHRLDKETSGVLLFAKDAEMAEMFFRLFNQRKVQKKYLALVDNCPKEDQGVIDNYIGTLGRYQGHAILGQVPKEAPKKCHPEHARTLWQCVKRGQSASLIACFPETGRTHQLRVHLSEMGHPILGDDTYCKKFTSSYRAIRVLLHAEQVSFLHPGTQELVVISSPIPQDFKKAQMDLGLDG